jgi:hypothetical protein
MSGPIDDPDGLEIHIASREYVPLMASDLGIVVFSRTCFFVPVFRSSGLVVNWGCLQNRNHVEIEQSPALARLPGLP